MNRLFYPAIFHIAEEGGFWVSFPDLPECFTEGDTMEHAYEMAVDALGLAITCRKEEGAELPIPSQPDKIQLSADDFLVVVEFDYLACKNAVYRNS